MPMTLLHRKAFTKWYCILFYLLFFFKLCNGMLLFQLQPHLFNLRFDMVTWLLMKTGLHQWLTDNPTGWIVFDASFYVLPLLYWLTYRKNMKAATALAFAMLIVNWVYVECYTLYPANSIESYIAWLLFPCLFATASLKSFYYVLHGLRYFFLYFFVSAAVWKVVQHGVFNLEEMSGVLLYQHKEYLASSPHNWYSAIIYWLINHPVISYVLYAAAAICEGYFIIGFFTKKYDRYLIAIFGLFLIMDVLIMRIPYWEVCPFILVLVYGKYSLCGDSKNEMIAEN